jgi:YYY domain-containing protein
MSSFLTWYLLITLLGWLTFPLAYRLLPALADRGYTLSRAFGLMLWGFIFWLFANLGIAQNDLGGLLLGLVVVGGVSAWILVNRKSEIQNWLGENRRLILTSEILFLLAFGFMAFFRSANPEILGTEKPMELMFINGIMNSPAFPPRDLWLSGYAISYYYFGYVMTAMLATFTSVPATLAFNLMLALIFGLAAVGAYGILYNLLQTVDRGQKTGENNHRPPSTVLGLSFLAPIFLLLVSNAEGFLEILHARGLLWREGSNFWTWLDIPDLRNIPPPDPQWLPDRFWWWWRASRVVQDYDFLGNPLEAIDEFPAFSFLLGDLHPHVLAIPFFLLAIAVALNLFLGGFRGRINLYFGELHISRTGLFLAAFMLGGMAFLNTWDILPVAALIVFSYALARVREAGWGWGRLEDVLLFGIPVLAAAYILYLPFFIGFDSQAGGILPNFMYITRGAHLWVMWGTLLVPIFAWLVHLLRSKTPADWRMGSAVSLGGVLLLVALMLALGLVAYRLRPEMILPILEGQQRDAGTFLADSFARRFAHIGSLLTLLALLIPALSFLFSSHRQSNSESTFHSPHSTFALLLVALGSLLILGPDFLYLRDNFGYRINTIFKFYYQAWILLSLASAYGTAVLFRHLRGGSNIVFSVILVIVLVVGLTYPVLGFPNKANSFKPPFGFTLDDFDRVLRENPDEAAAIQWLSSAPDGVVAEATGNPYSSYGRISIYSGLPTILGWGNHEGQWRGSDFQGLLAQRRDDIETLYATPDWQTAQLILEKYNVRYVVVGNLERTSYRVNEEKFNNFLRPAFRQGNITIYEVP